MAVDRSKQTLIIYAKDGSKVVEGKAGETSVAITGLKAGTVVAAGDYQAAWSDGTKESEKVDVPAFTVLTPAPDKPVDLKTEPTVDGAKISAS
ncbi:hypothetical protein FEZ51_02145 [Pediococcus stilesii]|uniref:Bacterial Ig domain-containing protein n=1 Tax=Pediococcus stilesii TaxID=331679 RepID=A0A5R9BZE2_9LACO|nr:hypothetical protein [Pediococcus stilesii]TLQ05481.1 hypothetical protein FEZ51_02145 [Pediococcus stilesii]